MRLGLASLVECELGTRRGARGARAGCRQGGGYGRQGDGRHKDPAGAGNPCRPIFIRSSREAGDGECRLMRERVDAERAREGLNGSSTVSAV